MLVDSITTIVNECTLPAKQKSKLRATLPPNVKLIRQTSAWNNSTLLAEVIVWLAAALAPWMDALQPILFFDAHKLHLAPCVFAACFLYNIWPLVIPPSTTWFMQPLDVDGFSLFKFSLRGLFQSARTESRCSDLTICDFLPLLCSTIRTVLQGRLWSQTFNGVGYGVKQQCIRKRMLLEIQWLGDMAVPSSRPSEDQLRLCLPKKFYVPANVLLKCADRFVNSEGTAPAVSSGAMELATPSSHARPRRVLPPSFVVAAERYGRKRARGYPGDIFWKASHWCHSQFRVTVATGLTRVASVSACTFGENLRAAYKQLYVLNAYAHARAHLNTCIYTGRSLSASIA